MQNSAPTALIRPQDLVVMNERTGDAPFRIDLVYAQADHPENIFGCALYRADAPFILHRNLASIVMRAAQSVFDAYGWRFVLMDGLRPIEAQAAMQDTAIVKRNPHWCEEPNRLLSPPGKGGHPRAMAVDIVLETPDGRRIDMGTPFDYLSEDRTTNPAARNYTAFAADILRNRHILEESMTQAAAALGHALLPLPSEWWDFRAPAEIYNRFTPLSDADLPAHLRMTR